VFEATSRSPAIPLHKVQIIVFSSAVFPYSAHGLARPAGDRSDLLRGNGPGRKSLARSLVFLRPCTHGFFVYLYAQLTPGSAAYLTRSTPHSTFGYSSPFPPPPSLVSPPFSELRFRPFRKHPRGVAFREPSVRPARPPPGCRWNSSQFSASKPVFPIPPFFSPLASLATENVFGIKSKALFLAYECNATISLHWRRTPPAFHVELLLIASFFLVVFSSWSVGIWSCAVCERNLPPQSPPA